MKHAAGVLEWINFPRYLRNIQADIPTMSIKISDELAVCIENHTRAKKHYVLNQ